MKQAQFAMEYLLVVSFSVIITIPLIWYLFQGYDDLKQDVNVEHLVEVSREIAFQAEKVFYQGPGSRTLITAYIPQGVSHFNITSIENTNYGVIDFKLDSFEGTISRTINAKICQNVELPTFSGPHSIEIIANSTTGCIIINEV